MGVLWEYFCIGHVLFWLYLFISIAYIALVKKAHIMQLLKQTQGYLRTKDCLSQGISTRDLKTLLQADVLEQVKRGLYRRKNDDPTPLRDVVDLCQAMPKAVLCLYSALAHYGLTTFVPTEVMIALPQGYHAAPVVYPPVQVFNFSLAQYQAGLEVVQAKEGVYRIYSPEKSVCDAFRFRRKLGDDTAKEALFTYLDTRRKDLKKLLDMAAVCRMSNVMKPYIEARIG